MKQLILYKSDFKSTGMWHHVLEMVGVETFDRVAGKVTDRGVETVTIRVQSAKEDFYMDDGE